MSELPVGSVVAGLTVQEVAGRGGMGVVYRAFDPELQRSVALKVIADDLAADSGFRDRFRRESRSAAAVNHPNIIGIHGAGQDAGLLYLVMQYADGTDLKELIARRGRLEPALATAIVGQIGSALDAAHRRGLVHRDVKPANVLVTFTDGRPHAYLTDFGLTRPIGPGEQITRTGVLMGTFEYMAPELFDKQGAGVASDVYALGCVLHHALTGAAPFRRPDLVALIAAHLSAAPPGLGGAVADPVLRAALEQVIARGVAKRPEDRYPSAGALGAAAEDAVRRRAAAGHDPGRVGSPTLTSGPSAPPGTAATDLLGDGQTPVIPPAGPVYTPPAADVASPWAPAASWSPSPSPSPAPSASPSDPGTPRPFDGTPPPPATSDPGSPWAPPASDPGTPWAPPAPESAWPWAQAGSPAFPGAATSLPGSRPASQAQPTSQPQPTFQPTSQPTSPSTRPTDRIASAWAAPPTTSSPLPSPLSSPLPHPPPPAAAPGGHRGRRVAALAAAVAVVGAVSVAGFLALNRGSALAPATTPTPTATAAATPAATGTPAPAPPGGTPIVLNPPEDNGTSVDLSWTGPASLDYAVVVAEDGSPSMTYLIHELARFNVSVKPGVRYCFKVRGSSADHVYESNVEPLRGAICAAA